MNYILRAGRYGVNQSRVDELVAAGVANLPSWASGPEDFWAAADAFERKNSRLCLELELNLPHELSREGQVAAIASYIDRLSAEAGKFPTTWAIHDEGGKNVHCHLMLQERALDGRARGPREHFKRANKKNPASGGVVKSRWWHKRENVFWSRALWADACNQALLREGHIARFDPRRKGERLDEALRAGDLRAAAALCTQTERHEGPAVASARRKLAAGRVQAADLPEQVVQIINGNDCARHYNNWLRDWSRSASDRELRLFLADHLHELKQRLEAESPSAHIQARAAWLEQQHAEALAENAERDAELAELMQVEQSAQAADLGLAGAVQAAHIEALAEDVERTAELAELVAAETERQAAELKRLGAVQAAHAEALTEDSERTAELAELVAGETERQAAELGQLAAVQADDLVAQYNQRLARLGLHQLPELDLDDPATLIHHDDEPQWLEVEGQAGDLVDQYNQRLARLGLHQLPELGLDDPATLIHHDDEPQWIEFEGQDGDLLGYWSDDPDTQWRYDSDTSDWVGHDPDRPSSGPRMG